MYTKPVPQQLKSLTFEEYKNPEPYMLLEKDTRDDKL